jgi:hypothetical protein
MDLDPKTIDELKAKHGNDLHLLSHDGVEFIAKRPGPAQYRRFRRMASDERQRADAAETLLRDCVVHPDQQGIGTALGTRPGLVDTFGGKLLELAGADKDCEVRPL